MHDDDVTIVVTTKAGRPIYRTSSVTKAHTFIINHCGDNYDFYAVARASGRTASPQSTRTQGTRD